MSVLVVDDEVLVRETIAAVLADDGYAVRTAEDALGAVASLSTDPPALVILDLNMPGVDGMALLERIRRTSDVPVILLTGRAAEHDRINGLRSGADDYVVKPFSVGELLARVESVLRRAGRTTPPPTPPSAVVAYDGFRLDTGTREAVVGGRLIRLTTREFDLLAFLASSPRQVFTRGQLLDHVWQSSPEWQDDATVTEHIRRIRHKIEVDPDRPRWIETIRGVGYRFSPPTAGGLALAASRTARSSASG